MIHVYHLCLFGLLWSKGWIGWNDYMRRIRLVWHLVSSLGDDTSIVELSYILSIFFDVSHVWHLCLVLGRG